MTISELRSFLVFASYYCRFVEGFVRLAAHLHKLVATLGSKRSRRSNAKVTESWTEEWSEL